MEKQNIYITTPIYYVNDVPHIGHAYTTIAADILARYYRQEKYNVFFLTGTDEHGQKIEKSAEKFNINIKEFVDNIVSQYKKLWDILGISYDGFIRTTDDIHKKTVSNIFTELYEKGDIYKGEYEGWYCVPCETYFTETSIKEEKNCPTCNRKISKVKEEAYFFKLSKYGDKLLDYYKKNPEFLAPKFRSKEMINFIKSGLHDLCVSRKTVEWGIKVPFDKEYCIYVWFDALINYISAINNNSLFKSFWPATVHLVGKEIYKFHTVIWPAMLMSLGFDLPRRVFGHGWWTVEGQKMSKSLGNVIDPKDIVSEFKRDALRYFLIKEVPFGSDGDFSHKNLMTRYNSELANDLGNLCSRVIKMVNKYFNGKLECVDIKESEFYKNYGELKKQYDEAFKDVRLTDALNVVMNLTSQANKHVDYSAPWILAKNNNLDELRYVLYELLYVLKTIAVLLYPFMPDTSCEILKQIGINEKIENINVNDLTDIEIGDVETLFPRKDKK